MENDLLQNIDSPQSNPLTAQTPPAPTQPPPVSTEPKPGLTKNPKIMVLLVLTVILVLLLIISAIVSLTRRSPGSDGASILSPTPAPVTISTPTLSPQSHLIPTQYLLQFETIQQRLNPEPEFMPPEIDPDIGI